MSSFQPSGASEQGLMLVGHGTRNPRGLAEFRDVAGQTAELAREFFVESCFLELAEPDIPTAVRKLLQRGIKRLTVAPVLLFAAGHAKRDIPAAVEEAVGKNAKCRMQNAELGGEGIKVRQCGALECHPKIVELSGERFREALAGRQQIEADETLLILVGRGSSEASAIAEMKRFAALRAESSAVGRVEICFAAVASPGLEEMFDWAAGAPYRRVVVQPHLLFVGQVLDQIATAVAKVGKGRPDQEWIVTAHLGPSRLVAEAVMDLARQSGLQSSKV